MAIRLICDVCYNETETNFIAKPLQGVNQVRGSSLEIKIAVQSTNGLVKEICKECLLDAVGRFDNRPKPAIHGGSN